VEAFVVLTFVGLDCEDEEDAFVVGEFSEM